MVYPSDGTGEVGVADLAALTTEAAAPEFAEIDRADTATIVATMNRENARVLAAVDRATPAIAAAVDAIAERMRHGGRLVYAGAGTAGRIGVLDASECPPTFSTAPDLVIGLIAGGPAAVTGAVEGAEDDVDGAVAQLDALGVGPRDCVVAISASGRTPYAIGALRHARALGALTVALAGNRGSRLGAVADHVIEVVAGPEVLTGSTRLKAGTAQKIVLNTISTTVMMRLGRTYGHLMVSLTATNAKLRARARRIVALATGADQARADAALAAAGGEVKTAIVMIGRGLDAPAARRALAEAPDHAVRAALEG